MVKRVTRLGGLLAAYQRRDPAARSKLEIFLLYPGVHAVLYHRLAHWLYRHHRFLPGPVRVPVEPVLDRHRDPSRRHHRPPAGDRPRLRHRHRRDRGDRGRLPALPGGHPGRHRQGQGEAPPHPGRQRPGGLRGQGAGPLHRGGQRPHRRRRRGPQRGAAGLHRRGVPARVVRVAGKAATFATTWTRSASGTPWRKSWTPRCPGWNFWKNSWMNNI